MHTVSYYCRKIAFVVVEKLTFATVQHKTSQLHVALHLLPHNICVFFLWMHAAYGLAPGFFVHAVGGWRLQPKTVPTTAPLVGHNWWSRWITFISIHYLLRKSCIVHLEVLLDIIYVQSSLFQQDCCWFSYLSGSFWLHCEDYMEKQASLAIPEDVNQVILVYISIRGIHGPCSPASALPLPLFWMQDCCERTDQQRSSGWGWTGRPCTAAGHDPPTPKPCILLQRDLWRLTQCK